MEACHLTEIVRAAQSSSIAEQVAALESVARRGPGAFVWLARDREDAQELAQEAMLATLQAIRAGMVRVSVESYAMGAARYQWIRMLQRRARARKHEPLADLPAAAPSAPATRTADRILVLMRARHPALYERLISLLLAGESPEAVRAALKLSPTQYRLTRSRALAAARNIASGLKRTAA